MCNITLIGVMSYREVCQIDMAAWFISNVCKHLQPQWLYSYFAMFIGKHRISEMYTIFTRPPGDFIDNQVSSSNSKCDIQERMDMNMDASTFHYPDQISSK